MKAYVCDWCGEVTKYPHAARFKEFTCTCGFGDDIIVTRKLHMCDHCYKMFKEAIINKSKERRAQSKL